jgi:hypothetical protein
MLRPSVPYGEDPAEHLGGETLEDPSVATTAALFNLAATPEKENHGAFLDYLSRRLPRGVTVLVDESGMAERSAGQPGAEARIAERKALWREFCAFHGVQAQFLSLLHPERQALDVTPAAVKP